MTTSAAENIPTFKLVLLGDGGTGNNKSRVAGDEVIFVVK